MSLPPLFRLISMSTLAIPCMTSCIHPAFLTSIWAEPRWLFFWPGSWRYFKTYSGICCSDTELCRSALPSFLVVHYHSSFRLAIFHWRHGVWWQGAIPYWHWFNPAPDGHHYVPSLVQMAWKISLWLLSSWASKFCWTVENHPLSPHMPTNGLVSFTFFQFKLSLHLRWDSVRILILPWGREDPYFIFLLL